jgi:hypothetical protein
MVRFDGRLSKKIVACPNVEKPATASVWTIAESFIVREGFVEECGDSRCEC